MSDHEIPVTFEPQGRTVRVAAGARLTEAAAAVGITLDQPCGGEGVCGKCQVVFRPPAPDPSGAERQALSTSQLEQGVRLACLAAVVEPVTVEIPDTSILASRHRILTETIDPTEGRGFADPVVQKRYVEMPQPDRSDAIADLDRIEREVGPLRVDLDLLRELSDRLRRTEFRGTIVTSGERLLDFEAGRTEDENYGVAIDLGTTTLAAVLVDLNSGADLAVTSLLNPQTRFGDDVLTRIQFASDEPQGLDKLHAAIVAAVNQVIGELARSAGASRERIYSISLAGNTTMQHLFFRMNPRYLGQAPFASTASGASRFSAAEVGLEAHPRARVYALPSIGGFVGGDIVAGLLATDLAHSGETRLLVDVGTNGEIVLAAGGKLLAAATAAGPAFEGARIGQGMRGATGAIERVTFNQRLETEVIGGVRPLGLCGSGLIDLSAELLRHGVMRPDGRFHPPGQVNPALSDDLRRRCVELDGQAAFLLADADESGSGRPIALTQRDIRQLQLASGAIRAGIQVLLKRASIEPADLDSLLIAGGFGNYIRRSNAQRIGLIPAGVSPEAIRFVGNTSLAGARLALLSRAARRQAELLVQRIEHIDLSTASGFRDAFAEAMFFPEAGE